MLKKDDQPGDDENPQNKDPKEIQVTSLMGYAQIDLDLKNIPESDEEKNDSEMSDSSSDD